MQKLAIVSGISRGLGASLALELLQKGFEVYGISRNPNQDLESWNTTRDNNYHYVRLDLADQADLKKSIEDILDKASGTLWDQIILINNAGVLDPIQPLSDCSIEELDVNIKVNLLAPLYMSARFIKKTKGLSTDRRIINISSGAGRKPYQGWSAYCSAKAGMDMFSRVAGVETAETAPDLKIVSLAPGIIDTRMQEAIRASEKKDFPLLDQFIEYHDSGALAKPADIAGRIIINFVDAEFESGTLQDIRDYM